MADVNANINIGINTSAAVGSLKALQAQISQFNQSLIASNAAAAASQRQLTSNLASQIAATRAFSTSFQKVETGASRLQTAIDKNRLSLREYFRYGIASSGAFGKVFQKEHNEVMDLASDRVKRLQTQYLALGRAQNGMVDTMAVRPLQLHGADAAIANQRQQLFNKLLRDGSTSMVNWGKNTQWAGRQLMVGFTVPLTIFGGYAASIFMDLDKQVTQFKRVYGDAMTPTSEADAMVAQIQELAKEYTKYGITVADSIEMASNAAATGLQQDELLAATEQALRLATLGQIDYQQALDATISLQSAFDISSKDLAETIDFLNATENQTIVSLDDITQAIPRVAPVIKGLGGDVKDLAAFLAAMREGGVNAAEGANALKSGLASLINPSKQANEMLKDMGINIDSIVKKNEGDLMGTVQDFALAIKDLSNLDRQKALATLFGKYQFARMGALFKNIIKDGSQAQRVIDLAGLSVRDLAALSEKDLGRLEESVGVKFLGAVERLKLAIAPIGEEFLKIATPIIDWVTQVFERFNELSPAVKKWGLILLGAFAVATPIIIMTVGLLGNFLGNMLKIGVALKTFFGRISGGAKNVQYLEGEMLDAVAATDSLEAATMGVTSKLNVQRKAVEALGKAYQTYLRGAATAMANLPQAFPTPGATGPKAAPQSQSGTATGKKMVYVPGSFASAHFGTPRQATPQEMQSLLASSQVTASAKKAIESAQAAGRAVMLYSNEVVQTSAELNSALNAGKATVGMVRKDLVQRGRFAHQELAYQMEQLQASPEQIKASVAAITEKIKASLKGMASDIILTEQQFADIVQKAYMEVAQEGDELVAKARAQMAMESRVLDPMARGGRGQRIDIGSAYNPAYSGRRDVYAQGMQAAAGRMTVPYSATGLFNIAPLVKDLSIDLEQASQIWSKFSAETKQKLAAMRNDFQAFSNAFVAEAKQLGIEVGTAVAAGADQGFNGQAVGADMAAEMRAGATAGAGAAGAAAGKAAQAGAQSAKSAPIWTMGPAKQVDDVVKSTSGIKGAANKFGSALANGSMKLQGAMFALDGVLFGLSMMDNSVGQFAEAALPAAFAMQGVSMAMPMITKAFSNPVTGIIAAVVAAAAGFWLADRWTDGLVERGRDLTDAMVASTDSLNSMADFFGKQTDSQKLATLYAERAAGQDITEGQASRAQEFLAGPGQQLLTDYQTVLSMLGSEAAGEAFVNQILQAIASGAIGPKMGVAIGAAAAQELGDTQLAADVSAKITEMIGLDGAKLTPDGRLKLFAEISASISDPRQMLAGASQIWKDMNWFQQGMSILTGKGTGDIVAEQMYAAIIQGGDLVKQQLDNIRLAYETGQISAKEFVKQQQDVLDVAKQEGLTWEGLKLQLERLYPGQEELTDQLLQPVIDNMFTTLQAGVGPAFRDAWDQGLRGVSLSGDAFTDSVLSMYDNVSENVDVLNREMIRSQISAVQEAITTAQGYMADATDPQKIADYEHEIGALEQTLTRLQNLEAGSMDIAVAIQRGDLSPEALERLLTSTQLTPEQLTLQIGAMPDENVSMLFELTKTLTGKGLEYAFDIAVQGDGEKLVEYFDLVAKARKQGLTDEQINAAIDVSGTEGLRTATDEVKTFNKETKKIKTAKALVKYLKEEDPGFLESLENYKNMEMSEIKEAYIKYVVQSNNPEWLGAEGWRGSMSPGERTAAPVTEVKQSITLDVIAPEDGGAAAVKTNAEAYLAANPIKPDIDANTVPLNSAIDGARKAQEDNPIDIKVNYVKGKGSPKNPVFTGGLMTRAGSGIIRKFSGGGRAEEESSGYLVPGDGARDSIPAMLTPGEFVIRKSSVEKYGVALLQAINMGAFMTGGIAKFHRGGGVKHLHRTDQLEDMAWHQANPNYIDKDKKRKNRGGDDETLYLWQEGSGQGGRGGSKKKGGNNRDDETLYLWQEGSNQGGRGGSSQGGRQRAGQKGGRGSGAREENWNWVAPPKTGEGENAGEALKERIKEIKDALENFTRSLYESTLIYTNINTTLKDVAKGTKSLADQILRFGNSLITSLRATGMSETAVQQIISMGAEEAKAWFQKFTKSGKLTQEGRQQVTSMNAAFIGEQMSGYVGRARTAAAQRRVMTSNRNIPDNVRQEIANDPQSAQAYVLLLEQARKAQEKLNKAKKGTREWKQANNELKKANRAIASYEKRVRAATRAERELAKALDPVAWAIEKIDKAREATLNQNALLEAKFAQAFGEMERAAAPGIKAARDRVRSLEKQIRAVEAQIDAIEELNEADQQIIRGLERQKELIGRQIEQIEYANELDQRKIEAFNRQKELINRQIAAVDRANELDQRKIEALDRQKEMLSRQLEVVERANELDQRRIEALDRQKEMINRQIQATEDLNEKDQQKISDLQREDEMRSRITESLNKDLELMSRREQDIQKSYDKRIQSLEKVSKINDHIINQQKSQLGIARALSQGDIYAATEAMEQRRQQQLEFSREQTRTALETGKQNAISSLRTAGGLTREQAEQQIQQIGDQTYQNSLAIRNVEDQIYERNKALIPLKEQIKNLDAQVLTIQDAIYERNLSMIPVRDQMYEIDQQILNIQDKIYERNLSTIPLRDQIFAIDEKILVVEDGIYNRNLQIVPLKDQIRSIDQQIEPIMDRIFDRETQIYQIQKDSLRPLQRALELAQDDLESQEEALENAKASLVIDGLTYEQLQNQIDAEEEAYNLIVAQIKVNGKNVKSIEKIVDAWKKVGAAIAAANRTAQDMSREAQRFADNQIAAVEASEMTTTDKQGKINAIMTALQNRLKEIENQRRAAIEQARNDAMREQRRQGRYAGGMIKEYATGSLVPGDGSRDSVLAKLAPGEYVIRKAMVKKYGEAMLNDINTGSFSIPKYKVASFGSGKIESGKGKTEINAPVYNTYSVNVNVPNANVNADEVANKVMHRIRSMDNASVRNYRGF